MKKWRWEDKDVYLLVFCFHAQKRSVRKTEGVFLL